MNRPQVNPLATALLVASALGTPGGATRAYDPPGGPTIAVVSYTITPGEEGSTSETVSVSRRDGKHSVTLVVKPSDQPARTETQPITASEFQAIWSIVIRDKLLAFQPMPVTGRVFDYGERILRFEVAEPPEKSPRTMVHRWIRPISNAQSIGPLFNALGTIAQKHGRMLTLMHFPRTPAG
ncbi:MAG: hypothetical protein U0794_12120 [Isosphaeraceae bacterium]